MQTPSLCGLFLRTDRFHKIFGRSFMYLQVDSGLTLHENRNVLYVLWFSIHIVCLLISNADE